MADFKDSTGLLRQRPPARPAGTSQGEDGAFSSGAHGPHIASLFSMAIKQTVFLNLLHLLPFKINTFLHAAHLLIKNEANNGLVKSNVLKTVSWNKSCLFAVGANSQCSHRKRKVGNNDGDVPPGFEAQLSCNADEN